MPQNYVLAHDWWAAQVISLYGEVFFNEKTDILYRIHATNEVGLPGTLSRIKKSFSRTPYVQSLQALEILKCESSALALKPEEIKEMRSYWQKIYSGSFIYRLGVALTDKKARKSQLEDFWRKGSLVFRTP
jgi:hypothetical protein